MDEKHMEAQHDTDGGHDRAARRRELKKAFHRAAAAYFKFGDATYTTKHATARMQAFDAYYAWKGCH